MSSRDNRDATPRWMPRVSTPTDLLRQHREGMNDFAPDDTNGPSRHCRVSTWVTWIPSSVWISQYRRAWYGHDFVAALSVASLYIPLSFSFAAVAHVPPSSGLWAFIIQPVIYALLGSSPRLVVGPEATGSMLVNAALHRMASNTAVDRVEPGQIAGLVTAMAGLILLSAGILRLGFLDRVLNRPLMRGSISGLGFSLIVDQSLPELGLLSLARDRGENRGSAFSKLVFVLSNLSHTHALSAVFAGVTLTCILGLRSIQRKYRAKRPFLTLIPDRLLLILVAGILTRLLHLEEHGLQTVQPEGQGPSVVPGFSLSLDSFKHVKALWSTSAVSALLGFFESSLTARSLSANHGAFKAGPPRSNTELIALGTANILGGSFSTLPAFGGFGRSQLNSQTGAVTPMSSIFLSLISLCCLPFVSSWIVYVPVATLAAMTTAVGIAMVEECVHDVGFFWRSRAWRELALMATVFVTTIAHSMTLGIVVGVLLTLYQLLRNATKSHSRLLDLTLQESWPGAERSSACIVIQMPQSLTFSNCDDLVNFLGQCETQWTDIAHAQMIAVHQLDRCFILDARGLAKTDACGLQTLGEALRNYTTDKVRIFISGLQPKQRQRFARSRIVDILGDKAFVSTLDEAEDLYRQEHLV